MRPEGTWKLGIDYAYRHADHLVFESDVDRRNKLGVENLWTRLTVALQYGITDLWTARVQVPYAVNFREDGYSNTSYQSNGFGDAVLGARRWFAPPDPQRWNFFGEADLTLPTGEDNEKWKGKPKKAYIQPGLGLWGVTPAAGFQKGFGDFAFTGSVAHVFNLGQNDLHYESADATMAMAGLDWVPLRFGKEKKASLGFSLRLTGLWIPEKDKRDGLRVGNTGGEWYHLVPGIHWTPNGGETSFYLSVPRGIYANVHSLQCAETWSVNVGVEFRF